MWIRSGVDMILAVEEQSFYFLKEVSIGKSTDIYIILKCTKYLEIELLTLGHGESSVSKDECYKVY